MTICDLEHLNITDGVYRCEKTAPPNKSTGSELTGANPEPVLCHKAVAKLWPLEDIALCARTLVQSSQILQNDDKNLFFYTNLA
jgi:hypothetical protein